MKKNRRIGLAFGAAAALVSASVVTMLPAGAANPDVVITTGSGDVSITEVQLNDNGTPLTQSSEAPRSGGGRVTDTDDDPVNFSNITINDGGAVVLDEFNIVGVTAQNFNFAGDTGGVYVFENGVTTQVGTAGFEDAVNRAVRSLDLRDYLGYDSVTGTDTPFDFDIVFDAPLRNSDYVLVSERDGNTFFGLIALDKNGNVIDGSNRIEFDGPYAWNTGFAPSNQVGQPMFFTVIDVEQFNVVTADQPIYGFRVDNFGEADVKFFGLAPDPFLPAMTFDKTVYAGHDSGASCGTSVEQLTVANGDDITFCFTVTNNAETNFDTLTITDADLGLSGVSAEDSGTFSVVSGSLPLAPTQTMVVSFETTAAGPVLNTATASADIALSTGGTNPVLSPEVQTDTAEVIAPDLATISGSVVDNNGDPIPGVTINLTGTSTGTTTTNASGDYTFTGLAGGTYTVSEVQPANYDDGPDSVGTVGGTPTGDASVNDVISGITLVAGDDSINNDFAEVIRPGSISGTVVDQNGDPIEGVAIALSGDATATTTTGADGTYSFTGLVPGTYTVTETTPAGMADGGETAGSLGGTVTDDVIADISLGAGEASTGNDFDESVASIAGTVVDQDGAGIPGVSIVLTGTDSNGSVSLNTTTDASGDYSFDQLLAGSYTVTETTPTGYTDGGETAGSTGGTVTDDVIADITLPAGVDSVDNDFDENVIANPASVSGTVVDDLGRPIPGVTITLSGDVEATTTTDADGNYTFAGLPPGTYTVAETQPVGYGDGEDTAGPAGGTVGEDLISAIIVVAGQDATDNDFAETTSSLAGTVVDQNGNGIAGVTVTLSGTNDAGQTVTQTTVTDANGDYSFDGLLAGTYTITESQPAGYGDGADTAGSTGGTVTNDVISEITLGAGVASVDNDFAEALAAEVEPMLPDTGSETPLIVAYGFMFIVSGAILTLTASEVGRRRKL